MNNMDICLHIHIHGCNRWGKEDEKKNSLRFSSQFNREIFTSFYSLLFSSLHFHRHFYIYHGNKPVGSFLLHKKLILITLQEEELKFMGKYLILSQVF